jgi:O-antigen ligase
MIGPVLSNLVEAPGRNPLFPPPSSDEDLEVKPNLKRRSEGGYFSQPESITVKELLLPTRIVFGAFFLILLARFLMGNRRVFTLDKTERWMLIFSLVVLANIFLLSNRLAFSLRIAIDAFIVPFLAYLMARRCVSDEERLEKFIRIMAYLGCFLIIVCLIEWALHPSAGYRVRGPFKTRDYLYVAMMVIFFTVIVDALLHWFRGQRSVLPRWIHLFVGIGGPFIVLLTLTRGNWVGFLAGAWTFAFLSRRLVTSRQKLATVGLSIALLPIFLLGALELSQTDLLRERTYNLGNIESRLTTYGLVLQAAAKNPVFGIGLNNSRDELRAQSRFAGGATLGTPHNSYLAILAEVGSLGLIAYLAIMWSIYRTGLKIFRTEKGLKDRWRGLSVVGMLTAYLVPGMFTHLAYAQLFAHIYLFACVGAIAGRYQPVSARTVSLRTRAKLPNIFPGEYASSRK